jgi:hypothetical protein
MWTAWLLEGVGTGARGLWVETAGGSMAMVEASLAIQTGQYT